MKIIYDKEYTNTFHSPGIEPWVTGFLKSLMEKRGSLGVVLDVGCGLGFMGFLLKLYLKRVDKLVGVDVSSERISELKSLGLYDELHVCDIRDFEVRGFDVVLALEVLHGLSIEVLERIEDLVNSDGILILALPHLPKMATVRALIERGYEVYRYLLRGLLLVNLKSYEVLTAGSSSFLSFLSLTLKLLRPILKLTKLLERGYLLAFKVKE